MNAFCTLEEAVAAAKIRFREEIDQGLTAWRYIRENGAYPLININGPGESGKDQVCSYIIRETQWCPEDQLGQFAVSTAVKEMIGWCLNLDADMAYMARRDHRVYWFEWCNIFRRNDPTILAKLAMRNRRIVSGIRGKDEFYTCREQKVFDIAVWIDRPDCEEKGTLEITADDCDYVLPNHGSLAVLKKEVWKFLDKYGLLKKESV